MPAKRKTRPAAFFSLVAPVDDLIPASRLGQRPGSPAALARSEWRDPDDITPGARRVPRVICGWRTYDPIRKMLGLPNSGVTVDHVMAADVLREHVDLATLGFSTERPMIFAAQAVQPRWGLGPAAMAQMRAVRAVARVVRLFQPPQLLLLDAVVLRNLTLRQWSLSTDPPLIPKVEKLKLLVILDRLSDHYSTDVQEDLAHGKRVV